MDKLWDKLACGQSGIVFLVRSEQTLRASNLIKLNWIYFQETLLDRYLHNICMGWFHVMYFCVWSRRILCLLWLTSCLWKSCKKFPETRLRACFTSSKLSALSPFQGFSSRPRCVQAITHNRKHVVRLWWFVRAHFLKGLDRHGLRVVILMPPISHHQKVWKMWGSSSHACWHVKIIRHENEYNAWSSAAHFTLGQHLRIPVIYCCVSFRGRLLNLLR